MVSCNKFPCHGCRHSWHLPLIWHRFWLLLPLITSVLCASSSGVSLNQPSARIDVKVTNEGQELTLWHRTGDQDLCQELQTICNKLQTIILLLWWFIDSLLRTKDDYYVVGEGQLFYHKSLIYMKLRYLINVCTIFHKTLNFKFDGFIFICIKT